MGTTALNMTITIDSMGNGGSRLFTIVLCPAGWYFYSSFCNLHCHQLLFGL